MYWLQQLTVCGVHVCGQHLFQCDIRMDFDTNEYPNIFVSRKWHERISEYIRVYYLNSIFDHRYQQNIRKQGVVSIEIKQKHRRNLKIDSNESKSCNERISEYICIQKVDTNEYPNIFISKKLYERIYE